MPGPRTTEDYFVDGPPSYNANRNPFTKKYSEYRPADYFNDALSEGELDKKRLPETGRFLDINNSIPAGAPENLKNLMRGLQGQGMSFNSSNVDNGVGFNNDSDNFTVAPGLVSFGGSTGNVSIATDGISAQYRPGQTGLSGDISFNPGFNGAPERVSGGINYTSPDRKFKAGISGSAAEGQNPTLKGNIGYNTDNGGFTAEGGIDAQGMPEGRIDFNVGQPQLSPEEIEAKKGMVPAQITDALSPNPNVSPQLPPQMTGESLSPGRQFAMKYINDNFGDRLRRGGSSLLY